MSEKRSETKKMRDLVLAIGGDMRGSENRKSWLYRVARTAGITPRAAKAAWHNEITSPESKIIYRLQRALEARAQEQEAAARNEYRELTERLAILERRLLEMDSNNTRTPADEMRGPVRSGSGMAGARHQQNE